MNPRITRHTHLWRTLAIVSLGLTAVPFAWSQDNGDEEDVFELSPFEVDASNDQGYYSERTLAGSRIDTPLRDLAASISVINREQLEDTAATDVNEVFLYELNTEGADTYTETITSFRDGIRDGNSGFSAANTGSASSYSTTNRIRGLAAPDNSRNYYRAIPIMGFDSYNTRSVEINRGPNSLLFGQGSPAGIVNQNTADAISGVQQSEVQLRIGSYGSWRAHINHNQPILDNMAIYVAALYDDEQFRRKPSYDTERRYYGAISYKPFDWLGIRGNYEDYSNWQSRPNSLTPIDAVTPWLNAGRPYYDPITRKVTIQETGESYGPYFRNDASPWAVEGVPTIGNSLNSDTSPWYVPGINFYGRTSFTLIGDRDNYFSIDSRQLGRRNTYSSPEVDDRPPAVEELTNAQWRIYDMDWTRSATELNLRNVAGPDGYRISNWQPSTVTDKSIYDWTEYNTNSPNYANLDGDTSNFEIDVKILDNWYIQLGYFDQNLDTEEHFTLGQLNANRLWVDTNINLPNGEPNPFFGQPYVEDSQPDTFLHEYDNTTFRAQSALTLDFTDNDGITRWLGRHNFIAIGSRADWNTSQIRSRATTVAGDPLYLMSTRDPATNTFWQRSERLVRQYYMGEAGTQGTVTRSAPEWGQPSYGGPTENRTLYYSWNNGGFQYADTIWGNAPSEATSYKQEERTDSLTLSWNASLWDDRIVPIVGYRHDEITTRQTTGTTYARSPEHPEGGSRPAEEWIDNGYPIFDVLFSEWNEQVTSGETWTYGVTVDVLRTDHHEFTLFYNQSENFNPQAGVNVDFYGNRLSDPGGEGKDYGFSVGLWDNKFTARVTWFEAESTGDTNGPANNAIDRLGRVDRDYFFQWAEVIGRIEMGQLPLFTDEDETTDPYEEIVLEDTPQLQNRIREITGLPYDYYATVGGDIRATQTNKAEGIEIAMTYNPSPNWTFRAAISSQETAFSDVGPEVDAWLDDRMAHWDAAVSPLSPEENVWLYNGVRPADLTNFWDSYGWRSGIDSEDPNNYNKVEDYYTRDVAGLISFYKAQQGRPVDNQRKWRANFIGRYTFTEGGLEGSFIGGGLRWEDKIGIGYYGVENEPGSGLLDTADLSRPIYDGENLYVDLWFGYRTKILDEKVEMLIQLNVRNLFEDGGLRPVGADFNGNLHTWRIIDPREFYLTTTLKF